MHVLLLQSARYSYQVLIKLKFSYFIKICPVVTELNYTDRQTNRQTHAETNNRFSKYCERV
jgi:phage FluMu protein Com